MKSNLKSLLIIMLVVSSNVYANDTALKFSPTDVKVFEETHKCIDCNLVSAGGFSLLSPFATFENSELSGSNLTNATISSMYGGAGSLWYGSKFDNAIMVEARFFVALDNATFIGTNLQRANLSSLNQANYVNFSNADLRGANLSNSLFTYSNFTDAKMEGAKLTGANLCHAIITEEQIDSSENHACAEKPDCSGRYSYPDGRPCL